MVTKFPASCHAIVSITCWLWLGSSAAMGYSTTQPQHNSTSPLDIRVMLTIRRKAWRNLEVSSRLESDGKWHHFVSSVDDLERQLGLSVGQELLLIQPNAAQINKGLPCVGRSREAVLVELRKIERCQEFTIVVAERGTIKIMTGYIGKRRVPTSCDGCESMPGPPGPPSGQREGIIRQDKNQKATVSVSFSWALLGFTRFPQKTEAVMIQPYVYQRHYLKKEGDNIVLAALRKHDDWKFTKMTYINYTAAREGRLEPHTLFKVHKKPQFINTNGGVLSLQSERITSKGTPQQLFGNNTFIEHFIATDMDQTLSDYEPRNHRGRYVAYDSSTRRLTLASSTSVYTKFFTKRVNPNVPRREMAKGPGTRIDGLSTGHAVSPGRFGYQGFPETNAHTEDWLHKEEC